MNFLQSQNNQLQLKKVGQTMVPECGLRTHLNETGWSTEDIKELDHAAHASAPFLNNANGYDTTLDGWSYMQIFERNCRLLASFLDFDLFLKFHRHLWGRSFYQLQVAYLNEQIPPEMTRDELDVTKDTSCMRRKLQKLVHMNLDQIDDDDFIKIDKAVHDELKKSYKSHKEIQVRRLINLVQYYSTVPAKFLCRNNP